MKTIYVVCIIMLLSAIMVMPAAAATTVTFYPDNDARLDGGDPDTNWDDDPCNDLSVISGVENHRIIIAHSDLSSIPSGVTIDSATLYLYMWFVEGNRTLGIHRVTASWTETGVTWNNQPGYDSTPTSSTSTGTTFDVWRTWDVTSDVQAFIDGTSNYGWLIKDNVESEADMKYSFYRNSEYIDDPTLRPYLEVTYTESEPAPLDFGDAPDPGYPSLLASDGARHTPTDTEFLGLQSTGDGKDFEPDAKIIDADLFDDGLLTLALTTGNPAQTVDFEVTNLIPDDQTLIVNILLDLNGDGDWNDPGEHVVQNQPIPLTGIAEGVFTSDPFSTVGATGGPTWMRITLTRHQINPNWDGTMASAGYAEAFECGETEDWLVELQEIVPPTPFLISGEVNYDNGDPVSDPAVTVLNTNTSEPFVVNISGNTYQVTTDSTHVGAGNVLHFNASNGNVTEFNRTIIPDDMNAGGFVQNITIVQPAVPLPDLIVESVSINPGCKHYYFANEPNVLDVTVKNIGTAAAGASNASVSGASGTSVAPVDALNPGESQTVTITDPVARPAGEVVTAIADCYGEVTESDETNNTSSIIDPDGNNYVINHGFKGKWLAEGYAGPDPGNMTTWKSYELHGDLVYSVGDSYYLSGYTPWEHYTANWTAGDLPIPDGATVKEARLYVYYTWDKALVMPDNVSTSFNGVNQDPYDVHYTDRKGYGTGPYSYNLPYGVLVYNVTDDFDTGGNYANVTKLCTLTNQVSMRGMMLLVVYEDPTEPLRQIFVIEEYDNLYGKASYCTTPEEATARALFTGPSIDMGTVVNANLITIAPGAGSHDGVYNPSEGDLIFNGQQLSDDAWDFLPGPTTGNGETELGACEHDVTALLQAAGNRVGMRSNDTESEWMEASNAFLVVEYGEPTGTCGDANDDGVVDMTDVMTVWYDFADYPTPGAYTISNEWAADVNCDGTIDMTDVMTIWYDFADYPTPGAYEVNCCE